MNVTDAAALIVRITRNESVEITATDGGKVNVRINGVDSIQTTDAADITSLLITASRNYANRIDLHALNSSSFSAIGGPSGLDHITVNGGGGNDLIIGSEFAESFTGSSGNDTLLGQSGDDLLTGGNGNDVLLGGDGNDSLNGDSGNDMLSGDIGDDLCLGGAGSDKISGGDSNDTVNGQAGNDSVSGDDGSDYVYGGAGRDTLDGAGGSDMVKGQAGRDVIVGNRSDVLDEAQAVIDLIIATNPKAKPILPDDVDTEYDPDFAFDLAFVPSADDFRSV